MPGISVNPSVNVTVDPSGSGVPSSEFDALKIDVSNLKADVTHVQAAVQTDATKEAQQDTAITALQSEVSSVQGTISVLGSNIAQKISGIHVEDIGNHAFDDINSLHFIGATVSDDGSQQATITIVPTFNVSNGQEPSSTSVSVENLEFPDATITTRNNGKIAVITIPNSGGGGASSYNLVIDNGVLSLGGVTKVDVPGAVLTDKTGGVVELKPTISMQNHSGNDYGTYAAAEIGVVRPLKVEQSMQGPNQPDEARVLLTIDHAAFEPSHAPSYLAYLNDDTNIVGKVSRVEKKRDGALWFDDVVYGNSPYISIARDKKQIGIQESDGSDPNVTGGQDFLVAVRINMKSTAPEDGFVRVYLEEYTEGGADAGYLLDVNSQPLSFERHYKAGDQLGSLVLAGIVNAKALRYFSCHVEDTFNDAYITLSDPTEGVNGILVQALSNLEKAGTALLQFESDIGQNIGFSSHYLGSDRANISWLIRSNTAPEIVAATTGLTMADGYGIYNPSSMKFGAVDGHLHFQDDGTNILDFNFHRIFSAEETQMLRGKEINVTATLVDKDNAFNLALLKWTGKPDDYTTKIYQTRTNGSIVFDAGWELAGKLFITEDYVAGDHSVGKTFTVPNDATNYAVAIYPEVAEMPMTLKLKELVVDVVAPFTGYVIRFPELAREVALAYSEQHKTLYQDNQGYSALRYTINGNDQPMPIGVMGKGAADVSLDTSLNTISGSMAKGGEGGIRFNADGKATVATNLRLWSDQPTSNHSAIMFWYELVEVGQTRGTMIDASKTVVTVTGGTKNAQYFLNPFSVNVTSGQRLILRVTGDGADCAFLQSTSPSAPLLYTELTFNEEVNGAYDDPFAGINLSQFTATYPSGMVVTKDVFNVANVIIPIDIPANANLVVLSAVKQLVDNTVRPVAKLDWSYSNTTKRLSLSFGETVLAGRVTLGLYL